MLEENDHACYKLNCHSSSLIKHLLVSKHHLIAVNFYKVFCPFLGRSCLLPPLKSLVRVLLQQGVNNLAKPPLTEIFKVHCANKSEVYSTEKVGEEEGENQRKLKRQCGSTPKRADDQGKKSESSCASVAKNENLQKAHNVHTSRSQAHLSF